MTNKKVELEEFLAYKMLKAERVGFYKSRQMGKTIKNEKYRELAFELDMIKFWRKLSEKYELEVGKEYTIDDEGFIQTIDKKT